jgi:hypothetical protein
MEERLPAQELAGSFPLPSLREFYSSLVKPRGGQITEGRRDKKPNV